MMDFDHSFSLEKMMGDAKSQMSMNKEGLNIVDNMAGEHLDGRSRLGLLGAVLVSLVWAVAFLLAYHYFGHYIPEVHGFPLGRLLLGVSLALVAFVLIGNLVKLKYYGTILSARRRVARLLDRVTKHQKAMPGNLQVFLNQRSAQWELPLKVGSSIDREASRISARLSSMETLSNSFIVKLKLFLYYLACVVWTAVGGYTLIAFDGGMDNTAMDILILVALTVDTCIIETTIARAVWSATDEEVGNVTLLAILPGPVIFFILTLVTMLVVALVRLVIANILEVIAVIIGIACLIGSISGG